MTEIKPLMKKEFVDKLVRALKEGSKYPSLSIEQPGATIELAYEIQQLFVAELQTEKAGYKAAVTSEPIQQIMSIKAPVSGVLFSSGEFQANSTIDDSKDLLIETELGFQTNIDITKPVEPAKVYTLFECYYPMIEIASPNLEGKPNGVDLIASNSASFGFIKGDRIGFDTTDPDSVVASLNRGNDELHSANCSSVMGGQSIALAWLINQILSREPLIPSNSLLMSGSVGPAHPATSGEYTGRFGELGEIRFSIK